MSGSPSPVEELERLGASSSAAERLLARGLDATLLISLDCPSPAQFVPSGELQGAISTGDIDSGIAANYPTFDPVVFERMAQSPWLSNEWEPESLRFFPGPLNRICELAEAGVHPSIASDLSWRLGSGLEVIELIDQRFSAAKDVEPVRVVLDGVEFRISDTGMELNEATEVERALVALSGSPNLAIEFLDVWSGVLREPWPAPHPMFGLIRFVDIFDSSEVPSGLTPLDRLDVIWRLTMFRRLRDVAPSIPDWHTAFAEEHPEWASRQ